MDVHHNKNIYSTSNNKNSDVYGNYSRTPCAQSTQRTQNQHFLSPYPVSVPSNNVSQHLMYNTQNQPMYNIMYGPQSVYRSQNSFPTNAFSQSMDSVPWMPESCVTNADGSTKDKYIKYDNKVSHVECSSHKNYYYNKNSIVDPQWFYGTNYDNQKYNELPSCSQITPEHSEINSCCNPCDSLKNVKSVKYCSIQKYSESNSKLYIYNKFDNHNDIYLNQSYSKMKEYSSCSQLNQPCNLYPNSSVCREIDKKVLLEQNSCDLLPPANQNYFISNANDCAGGMQSFEDKTEESNGGGGESDIVVEDSEDEESDVSEEIEKEMQSCLICNVSTGDNQFCLITSKNPLTSYSQSAVSEILFNLLGFNLNNSGNLCSTCMNLINTLDNLEMQLKNIKYDLIEKYKTTVETLKLYVMDENLQSNDLHNCNTNNTYTKNKLTRNRQIKLKDVCGVHSFKCRVCEKIFSLKKFYHFHMSKHKIKSSYLCEHCGCNFVKQSNLLAHLRRHSNKFNIRCSQCKKGFIYKSSLQQHKCNKNKIKIFICHICGKTFRTKTNLTEHENFCSGTLPHSCIHCEKRFPCLSKLNQHVKVFHDKVFIKICSVCGKGFGKHSDFKSHMLSHSSDKKFECQVCKKSYKTLSNLNQHTKSHNQKLPFNCDVCHKGFLRKENLQAHLNVHNGLKPFNCVICEKKFASRKNLDAHIRIHKGTAKKQVCPICAKQISHGLEEHIRTHSNVKQFECSQCDMKFVTKGALAKHRKRKHENIDLDIL